MVVGPYPFSESSSLEQATSIKTNTNEKNVDFMRTIDFIKIG